MEGRAMCCKVWTAQRHDSLGVIMIERSLIDCLSQQNPPKHLCAVDEALVAMLSPPPVDLSWAPIPSSMIHEHWSSLMTRAGLQPKPSVTTSNSCPLHN